MPSQCSVPNCRGNYNTDEYVSVFGFPRTEPLRSLWLKNIGREEFEPSVHSKVCERHFDPSDILRESSTFDEKLGEIVTTKLRLPKLKEGAVPSPQTVELFPPMRKRRRISKTCEEIDLEMMSAGADFNNLLELEDFLQFLDLQNFWTLIKKDKALAFMHLNWNEAPKVDVSIVMDENLSVTVFHGNVKVKLVKNLRFPRIVKSVSELNLILKEVKNKGTFEYEVTCETESIKKLLESLAKRCGKTKKFCMFLREQVSVLTEKNSKTFSPDMLVFSSLLYFMAPHAYKFICHSGYLILPDPETINKLCMPLHECTYIESNERFLQYAKQGYELTTDSDKCVVLQVEEIYLKPFFEDIPAEMSSLKNCTATSAYVFMITSLCSPFRDIAHIMPVPALNARDLNSTLKQIIIELEGIGYSIIAVVTDNSYLNKRVMSFFSDLPLLDSIVYKHPVHSSRPLFHLIGFVHSLKSVRNDWMNKKTSDECIFYPPFGETCNNQEYKRASFSTLRKIHQVELNLPPNSLGSRLTHKALSPNYVDKQDPKLVLKIFSPAVQRMLMRLGEKKDLHYYQETAEFIKLMCSWCSIVNPKSLLNEAYSSNIHELPLSTSDEKYEFLKTFLDWLDAWSNMNWDSGMLRAETYSVLRHSTYALLELTSYCKNELGISFIFPGNFLTENQLALLGFFKSHPGIHKFIPQKDICVLKSNISCSLSLIEKDDINLTGLHLRDSRDLMEETTSLNTYIPLMINDEDFSSTDVNLSTLIYLAACSVRSVLKRLQCSECQGYISTKREVSLPLSYKSINISGENLIYLEKLYYPQRSVVNIVHCIFVVLHKLFTEHKKELMKLNQPDKILAYSLTWHVIESLDLSLNYQECEEGHNSEKVLKMLVKAVVYTILNNYRKKTLKILAPVANKSIDILLSNPKYDVTHLLGDSSKH